MPKKVILFVRPLQGAVGAGEAVGGDRHRVAYHHPLAVFVCGSAVVAAKMALVPKKYAQLQARCKHSHYVQPSYLRIILLVSRDY